MKETSFTGVKRAVKKIVEYSDNLDLTEIYKLAEEGCQFICPKCKAELLVALSPEEAREKKIPTGLFCPINTKHVHHSLVFDTNFWDGFKEEVAELEKEKLKNK